MNDFLSFKNTGLKVIGDNPLFWKGKPRTVIVLGVARGGTSLVSGALHHLGCFMGDRSVDPVFEDLKLSEAIESDSWTDVDRILNDYNARHIIWGYKRPLLFQDADRSDRRLKESLTGLFAHKKVPRLQAIIRLHNRLVTPIYVIIFKDIFSVANRIGISSDMDMVHAMKRVLLGYEGIADFISNFSPNAFLVSYEKAVANKKLFVDTLINYCQLEPSDTQINTAVKFITHDPKNYLDISRTTKSIGYLDKVTDKEILGWARYLNDERIAEVVLIIDGREIQKGKANLFRKDLLDTRLHSKGTCAFAFKEFDSSLLKAGSKVRVKVVDDINDLENSPFLFNIAEGP